MEINAQSEIKLLGRISGDQLEAGDCFEIHFPQPYVQSKDIYESTGKTDFYVPFPDGQTYSLGDSSRPSSSIERTNDYNLKVTLLQVNPNTEEFSFDVRSFQNPFSQTQKTNLQVRHFKGCQTRASSCKEGACAYSLGNYFVSPDTSSLNKPVMAIGPASGAGDNLVASADGLSTFTLTPGIHFPKYGGLIQIQIPLWFQGGPNPVFNFRDPKTQCSSSQITIQSQQTNTEEHFIYFSTYTPGSELVLSCTNYNNPIYNQVVTGFEFIVSDNEQIPNQVAKYPAFNFEATDLVARQIESGINFDFYLNNEDDPTSPVPIQTDAGLSIEFDMGKVPIDTSGCYVKYTFPNDIPLPEEPLIYLGYDMMANARGSSNLQIDAEVFIAQQKYENGNVIVMKGCQFEAGVFKKPKVKIVGIRTPLSQKNTNNFVIEVYKDFNQQDFTLSNKIIEGRGFILDSMLTSGSITEGQFTGLINFIQFPATHEIQFKLQNELPSSSQDYDSRIVIVMPQQMMKNTQSEIIVKTIGGFRMLNLQIADETDFPGCSGTAVCYSITHSNINNVPQGATLKFSISGTLNQEAVEDAGPFTIQTQVREKATGVYYNIDNGSFESNFITQAGGISLSLGKNAQSDNYRNFYEGAVYTIYFNLGNYISKDGKLKVNLPEEIELVSDPFASFVSSEPNLVSTGAFNNNQFTLLAQEKIEAGDIELSFGGVRNPRSFQPTSLFVLSSTDVNGHQVGQGAIDNIKMNLPGEFTVLTVEEDDKSNGAKTHYTVSFVATIPVKNDDIFTVVFPETIQTPKEPTCDVVECLDEVKCTSESGKIVITLAKLKEGCSAIGAKISFKLHNIINAPSQVKSDSFGAYWTSKVYQKVAEYTGTTTVQNQQFGSLNVEDFKLEQQDEDFGVYNWYTIRFTPLNPIPQAGWVQVIYPSTVVLKEAEFIDNCQAITSLSYSGEKHCMLDKDKRTIWFYDIFRDQEVYTSEIALFFKFSNPDTNFFDDVSDYDQSFHVKTFDFDLRDFPDLKTTEFSDAAVDAFIQKVKPDPLKYAYGIDMLESNQFKAQLKCNSPCYTCLDGNPDWCMSCWGPGASGTFTQTYLQSFPGGATCKDKCDVGSSTDGKKVDVIGADGSIDPTKQYQVCVDCELSCSSCKGESYPSNVGDKFKCVTCASSFPYFVAEEEVCYVSCAAGYFTKREPNQFLQGECGICELPCTTCKKCSPGFDKNCDVDSNEPSKDFCTSCSQEGFFPQLAEDLDSVQQYFREQASMVRNDIIFLTAQQKTFIDTTYPDVIMIDFLKQKVLPVSDLEQAGLIVPDTAVATINADTTYEQLFMAQYNQFSFPPQSLFENICQPFCDPGYASINGVCRPCKSPCSTCRNEITRCLTCRQDQPQRYSFGRGCYEVCPPGTIPDDENNKCLSCNSGCLTCRLNDTNLCIECQRPLLLFQSGCVSVCPEGYRKSFTGKECEEINETSVIWFPITILTLLAGIICVGGQWSSKNVFGLHRKMLSFYAITGVIDVLAIWAQLLFTFLQGQFWHLIFPGVALGANYFINLQYKQLWETIDPPKPDDEDKLTLDEVKLINQCDVYFDRWNGKYFKVANSVYKVVVFWSHKFFMIPYTHFFGYLHLTVRIQDHMQVWQWDVEDYMKFRSEKLRQSIVENPNFKFRGRLVKKRIGGLSAMQDEHDHDQDIVAREFEGGKCEQFNPLDYVQSPLYDDGNLIPDLRIFTLFEKQIKIDFIFIRLVLIIGNCLLLFTDYIYEEPFQLQIQAAECVLMSILMLYLQTHVKRNWEDHKLPFKMKDTKANYLFKEYRYPKEVKRIEEYLALENDLPEWNKYRHLYNFKEIYLDNKLEELLCIFGRRQCKSCIEFNTGTELEEDPRKVRSYPLSPRGEELYHGMQGDFDLIDFQLQDNVYHEIQQPSTMFQSVARDFSDFGAQVFSFDVMKALNRKGGDLLNPGVDDEVEHKKTMKKKRGRKNKYYRQIDQEDDDEANQISGDSDNDGLDHVKEEDEEDDEEEMRKRRMEIEKARQEAKKKADAEAERLRLAKAQKDLEEEMKKQRELKEKAIKDAKADKLKKEQEAKEEKERRAKEIKEEKEKRASQAREAKERREREEQELRDSKLKEQKERQEREAKLKKDRDIKEAKEKQERDSKLKLEKEAKEAKLKKEKEEKERKRKEELERKKKEKEDELNKKKAKSRQGQKEASSTRRTNEAELQAEEEKIAREHEKAQRDKMRAEELRQSKIKEKEEKELEEEEELKNQIVEEHSPDKEKGAGAGTGRGKRRETEEDRSSAFSMLVQDNALNNFKKMHEQEIVESPPMADSRRFNENDIIGNLDRDEKGNITCYAGDKESGKFFDKDGRATNHRGYMINPDNGDVINNLNGQRMFSKSELDERGEVPAPFSFEKYNFNPHQIRGDFDYDRNGNPRIMRDKAGNFCDKRGDIVSARGFKIDQGSNIIDYHGRKKFDVSQIQSDGDLPKLYNYNGRRFDITDCIGQFEKDQKGNIQILMAGNGQMVDVLGRKVNSKGYLVDELGNVVDKDGRQIFERKHLQNDEIPKIFPFTKFNVKNILGTFEMDPGGVPMLAQDQNGNLVDNQGRRVNKKGYLVDEHGNVIDKNGNVMFKKKLLDHEEDIPKVLRTGLLKSDTASSLSRLMSEIEKNQPSDFDQEERKLRERVAAAQKRPRGNSGNTSVDSMMEDHPGNYDEKNQGYDMGGSSHAPQQTHGMGMDLEDHEMEYDMEDDEAASQAMDYGHGFHGVRGSDGGGDLRKRKHMKKKKKKRRGVEFEDPSLREHLLAGAYGGVAKPKVKRPGVKYTTDVNAGLRDIATPVSAFHRDPSKKHVNNLMTSSMQGFHPVEQMTSARALPNNVHRNAHMDPSSHARSEKGSAIGKVSKIESTTKLLDPQQREAYLKARQMDEIRRKQIAKTAAAKKRAQKQGGKQGKDIDFEKMFGKDIDEFLDDSEWEIESVGKMSQFSRHSKNTIHSAANANKLKNLEKLYLNKIEQHSNNRNTLQVTGKEMAVGGTTMNMKRKASHKDKGPNKFREFQDRFVDDPGFIHRGRDDENLSMHSKEKHVSPHSNRKRAWDAMSKGSSKNNASMSRVFKANK